MLTTKIAVVFYYCITEVVNYLSCILKISVFIFQVRLSKMKLNDCLKSLCKRKSLKINVGL